MAKVATLCSAAQIPALGHINLMILMVLLAGVGVWTIKKFAL